MEFPKGYIQERENYRVNENERKLHNFLRDYFAKAYSRVVSGVRYYLFNKTALNSTDTVQIEGSLHVSGAGVSAPLISVLKFGGTAEAPTATPAGVNGGFRFLGYNGTTYYHGASVRFNSTENAGLSARGTEIYFYTTPTGTVTDQLSGFIAASGSWASGTGSLATTATKGFLYIPTCAGVPTGVPESISGRIPLVADTSGGKIYAYLGGWTALN